MTVIQRQASYFTRAILARFRLATSRTQAALTSDQGIVVTGRDSVGVLDLFAVLDLGITSSAPLPMVGRSLFLARRFVNAATRFALRGVAVPAVRLTVELAPFLVCEAFGADSAGLHEGHVSIVPRLSRRRSRAPALPLRQSTRHGPPGTTDAQPLPPVIAPWGVTAARHPSAEVFGQRDAPHRRAVVTRPHVADCAVRPNPDLHWRVGWFVARRKPHPGQSDHDVEHRRGAGVLRQGGVVLPDEPRHDSPSAGSHLMPQDTTR